MERISEEEGKDDGDIVVSVNDEKTGKVATEKTPISFRKQSRKSRSASVIDNDLMGHSNSLNRAYVRTTPPFRPNGAARARGRAHHGGPSARSPARSARRAR